MPHSNISTVTSLETGSSLWPGHSAELSPLNYFLWGYLKGKVDASGSNFERNPNLSLVNISRPKPQTGYVN